MKNVSFIFRLSPYNTDKLLPQTAKALEKRMELLSRKRYPRLYDKFECMIETEDLFLFVHDTRVTLLQKTDLTKGSVSAFLDFLSKHDPQYGAHYSQLSG